MRVPMDEHQHQKHLMIWARFSESRFPCLRLLFAVPNAARRTKAERGRMLEEGLRAGVPDLCLPVPRQGYHGLFIELKVDRKKSRATRLQREWLTALREQGYKAVICYGWEEGARVLQEYLQGAIPRHRLFTTTPSP